MRINEIIQQPEGRRLEFKETLPTVADLTKTIVAFANDAGGELFIGIRNEPREMVGERGISFQVQFIKKETGRQSELQSELRKESLYGSVLRLLNDKPLNTGELSELLGQKNISGQLRKVIRKLHQDQLITNLIPNNVNHPAQRHQLTEMGRTFLKQLKNQN